jgi:hypothetical protein
VFVEPLGIVSLGAEPFGSSSVNCKTERQLAHPRRNMAETNSRYFLANYCCSRHDKTLQHRNTLHSQKSSSDWIYSINSGSAQDPSFGNFHLAEITSETASILPTTLLLRTTRNVLLILYEHGLEAQNVVFPLYEARAWSPEHLIILIFSPDGVGL